VVRLFLVRASVEISLGTGHDWYCGVYTPAGKNISQRCLILTFLWILKGVSSGDEFIHLLSCFLVNKEDGKRRIMKPVMEVVTTVAYPRIK
jgi:hypothetical protein